ncbi:MAG TPA: ubiquinol-cytochrome c reductase iron-sulfur subunit [Ktedonobacterales bacterium]|jgi:Rieske Fe-S protein|nr:ubiquinol-cytochrome c reductase iron-sulfur subunit [Ktedonobacterales bacterium]
MTTPSDRQVFTAPGRTPTGPRRTRWQAEFPYHWDADDVVSRRELLRFAVLASGALFAATAGIAALGQLRPPRTSGRIAIARVGEIAPGGVKYFEYTPRDEQAILLRLANGQFVAYSGRCTHLSCAVYFDARQNKLLCPCHEGVFDPETGDPIAGPPQRPLPRITLRQEGDTLVATEEAPQ